jgi:hypothetical protein
MTKLSRLGRRRRFGVILMSPTPVIAAPMTAEQFLALAETLRSYAHHSGRDMNAAHMFVHEMLMRATRYDSVEPPQRRRQAANDGARAA